MLSFELQHLPDACKDQEGLDLQGMAFEQSSGASHVSKFEFARFKEGNWRQSSTFFRTLGSPCGSSNERSQSFATSELDASACVEVV
jgi:hypothetical protein